MKGPENSRTIITVIWKLPANLLPGQSLVSLERTLSRVTGPQPALVPLHKLTEGALPSQPRQRGGGDQQSFSLATVPQGHGKDRDLGLKVEGNEDAYLGKVKTQRRVSRRLLSPSPDL